MMGQEKLETDKRIRKTWERMTFQVSKLKSFGKFMCVEHVKKKSFRLKDKLRLEMLYRPCRARIEEDALSLFSIYLVTLKLNLGGSLRDRGNRCNS